ncbi:nucleotidyl transferase AbiEii/AbiGii toxin family protein [Candidatus Gottesmanbacteria bacterium]|nr:nucleotidyl transferase AbiEii/AbiGii toxin family protein [Candidatus Gottesmanbacteria bacterium]
MGQTILTREQIIVLKALSRDEKLVKTSYFTGGTALSEVFLHHRESDDIDIFSEIPFDPQALMIIMTKIAKKENCTLSTQHVDPVYIFVLSFPNKKSLKVDFTYYPYPLLEKSGKQISGIAVDSFFDIAVNKLVTITQRTTVKDFVDLYYLLQTFTFWDLRNGAKKKFSLEIDPLLIASDFLAVESFDMLPRMKTKLTLSELKSYFVTQATTLGKKSLS